MPPPKTHEPRPRARAGRDGQPRHGPLATAPLNMITLNASGVMKPATTIGFREGIALLLRSRFPLWATLSAASHLRNEPPARG